MNTDHSFSWMVYFFDNLIMLLPAKGLYFEILIVRSMTESIIQPEPFPKDFGMFVIIAV